jgi:glyoxylase-like metal-dependent hydrolase (beta-lactamase superfamily II)
MRFLACRFLAALVFSLACAVPGAGQMPAPASPALQSYRQARTVLDAAVAAIGGEKALRDLDTVSREMAFNYVDVGQQRRPWPGGPDLDRIPVAVAVTASSLIDYRGGRFLLTERYDDGPGDWFVHQDAVDATGGFETGTFREERPFFAVHSAEDAAGLRNRATRLYPEALLRAALDKPENLLSMGRQTKDGRIFEILSFADAQGPILLFFDAATHLLVRTEVLRDHAVLGDISSETVFDDYRQAGTLRLPFHVYTRIAGFPSRDYRLSAIRTGAAVDETRFRPPAPAERVQIQAPPPAPMLRDAGQGVYEILGSYNLMFAVFRDYVVLVEAPQDEAYAEAAFKLIRSVAPDKPIRVVATHYHYDHIGGIRYAISQGSPIWTTADARDVILRAVGAKRTFRPDRLSLSPRPAVINVVGDSLKFDDGTQRVELYDFGPSTHADHILAAYFPRVKTLHAPDLWDILTPQQALGGIDAEIMLHRARDLKLDFRRFVPIHGVPAARDDLERAMAIRARYVPPVDMDAWTRR